MGPDADTLKGVNTVIPQLMEYMFVQSCNVKERGIHHLDPLQLVVIILQEELYTTVEVVVVRPLRNR